MKIFLTFLLFLFFLPGIIFGLTWDGDLNPEEFVKWEYSWGPEKCPNHHTHAIVKNPDQKAIIKEVELMYILAPMDGIIKNILIKYSYIKHNIIYIFDLSSDENGVAYYIQTIPKKINKKDGI